MRVRPTQSTKTERFPARPLGRVEEGVEVREGPHPLIQLWFAGNHSDIGGSFAEAESRPSDNALWWMIEQATARLAKLRHINY